MSILDEVHASLRNTNAVVDTTASDNALREAERMADLFSDVKPQPYVVPIQRFIGVPVLNKSELDRG